MKHFNLPRLSLHIDRFNKALLAALAAMALTACGDGPQTVAASSSLASGVQQILHAGGSNTAVRRGERLAQSTTTSYQTNEEHP